MLQDVVDAAAENVGADALKQPIAPLFLPVVSKEVHHRENIEEEEEEEKEVAKYRLSPSTNMLLEFLPTVAAPTAIPALTRAVAEGAAGPASQEHAPAPQAASPTALPKPSEEPPSDDYAGVVDLLLRAAGAGGAVAAPPSPSPGQIHDEGKRPMEYNARLSSDDMSDAAPSSPLVGRMDQPPLPFVRSHENSTTANVDKDGGKKSSFQNGKQEQGCANENKSGANANANAETEILHEESIVDFILAAAGPNEEDGVHSNTPTSNETPTSAPASARSSHGTNALVAEVDAKFSFLDTLIGSTDATSSEDEGAGEAAAGEGADDTFALARSRLSGRRRSISTPPTVFHSRIGRDGVADGSPSTFASSLASARRELKTVLDVLKRLPPNDPSRAALVVTRDNLEAQLELAGGAVLPLSSPADAGVQSRSSSPFIDISSPSSPFSPDRTASAHPRGRRGADAAMNPMEAPIIVNNPFQVGGPSNDLHSPGNDSSGTDEDTLEFELLDGHNLDDRRAFDILRQPASLVAEQITIYDFELFRLILASELSCADGCAWSGKDKAKRAPNVVKFTHRFNHVSFWVVEEILKRETEKRRTAVLGHFIKIAKELKKLNNLHGLLAVLSALRMAPIYRLRKSWAGLKSRSQARFDSLLRFISEDFNHKELRLAMEKLRLKNENCIPALGILQTDLVHLADSQLDRDDLTYQSVDKVSKILHFQSGRYRNLMPLPPGPSGVPNVQEYMQAFKYSAETRKSLEDANWGLSLRREKKAGSSDERDWNIDDYRSDVDMHSMGIRGKLKKIATLPRSLGIKGDVFTKGHRKTRSLGAAIGQTVSTLWNSASRGGGGTDHEYTSMKSPEGGADGSSKLKSPISAKATDIGKGRVGKKRSSYGVLGDAPVNVQFRSTISRLDKYATNPPPHPLHSLLLFFYG